MNWYERGSGMKQIRLSMSVLLVQHAYDDKAVQCFSEMNKFDIKN
jgi:hypothetical protein